MFTMQLATCSKRTSTRAILRSGEFARKGVRLSMRNFKFYMLPRKRKSAIMVIFMFPAGRKN